MLNVILSFALLFNNIYFNKQSTEVEKIEYFTNNNDSKSITIDISLKSICRDVVQLTIFFYDENKNVMNNKYFSSSLFIEGKTKTKARIPMEVKTKLYFNIILYSSNLDEEIENIMFPIYPKQKVNCDLNLSKTCKSDSHSLIFYSKKKIYEEYEFVSLLNDSLDFKRFDNIVPLSSIRLMSNLIEGEAQTTLILDEKIESLNIDYYGGYLVPIRMIVDKGIITFNFSEKYYIDFIKGETSQNYIRNGRLMNEILLPYKNYKYEFEIDIKENFVSFGTVKITFSVITSGKLIGNCENSKYCIRRGYF